MSVRRKYNRRLLQNRVKSRQKNAVEVVILITHLTQYPSYTSNQIIPTIPNPYQHHWQVTSLPDFCCWSSVGWRVHIIDFCELNWCTDSSEFIEIYWLPTILIYVDRFFWCQRPTNPINLDSTSAFVALKMASQQQERHRLKTSILVTIDMIAVDSSHGETLSETFLILTEPRPVPVQEVKVKEPTFSSACILYYLLCPIEQFPER